MCVRARTCVKRSCPGLVYYQITFLEGGKRLQTHLSVGGCDQRCEMKQGCHHFITTLRTRAGRLTSVPSLFLRHLLICLLFLSFFSPICSFFTVSSYLYLSFLLLLRSYLISSFLRSLTYFYISVSLSLSLFLSSKFFLLSYRPSFHFFYLLFSFLLAFLSFFLSQPSSLTQDQLCSVSTLRSL